MGARRLVLAGVTGYVLGTFPSADVASHAATMGTVDLRAHGSGNPGATNAAQVLGKAWGAAVLAADFAKGSAAALAGRAIAGDDGAVVGAAAAVAGHCWPAWNGFRGGKGVATTAGGYLVIFPPVFPVAALTLAVGALSTRRAETTVRLTAPLLLGASVRAWRGRRPNAWGPASGFRLVAFAAATSAMVLGRFRTTS
jgi:glycerol-3-phosphate acyltransferase PlsY